LFARCGVPAGAASFLWKMENEICRETTASPLNLIAHAQNPTLASFIPQAYNPTRSLLQ
jgi:hypothetical protein